MMLCKRMPLRVIAEHEKLVKLRQQKSQGKKLIAQMAPAVRVSVGEAFGVKPSDISPKQIVSCIRKMGFDYVFDTLFSADVTIFEEGTELLHKIKSNETSKPLITSCCIGWIQVAEKSYPELIPYISTTKSPQMIMGAIVKHIFSKVIDVQADDIYMASFMPCVKKQDEADKIKERDVDLVITTNELISMIRDLDIDIINESESDFDDPLGIGSGGGAIFGKTGGVMVSALRYAYYILTGQTLGQVEFKPLEGFKNVMEASITLTPSKDNVLQFPEKEMTLRVAVVTTLGSIKKLMDAIKEDKVHFDFVEVMLCVQGCISGAGNPSVKSPETLKARRQALTAFDDNAIRKAPQDNEHVQELYNNFVGEPNGHIAHDLFHTHHGQNKNKN